MRWSRPGSGRGQRSARPRPASGTTPSRAPTCCPRTRACTPGNHGRCARRDERSRQRPRRPSSRRYGVDVGLSANVVAELQRVPLLTVAEMSSALDAERSAHGMYAWWLINSDALPAVPTTPHPSEPVGLLYVGVGPSSARSKRKLRDRFRDHTRKNTGSSTFRLVLASFLFEREGWRPYWTDRPMLSKPANDALSEWQAANLRAQWVEVAEPVEARARRHRRDATAAESRAQRGALLLRHSRCLARRLSRRCPGQHGRAKLATAQPAELLGCLLVPTLAFGVVRLPASPAAPSRGTKGLQRVL